MIKIIQDSLFHLNLIKESVIAGNIDFDTYMERKKSILNNLKESLEKYEG